MLDSGPAARLDVGAVLRRAARVWWADVGLWLLLGSLLALPGAAARLAAEGQPASKRTLLRLPARVLQESGTLVLAGLAARRLRARRDQATASRTPRPGWGWVASLGVTALTGETASTVGLCLLIVPGLEAQCALFVAAPVAAHERLGPARSLRRSLDLTRGQRWRILGLWLAAWAACVLPLLVGAAAILLAAPEKHAHLASAAAALAFGGAASFEGVVRAVCYDELCVAHDGPSREELLKAFD